MFAEGAFASPCWLCSFLNALFIHMQTAAKHVHRLCALWSPEVMQTKVQTHTKHASFYSSSPCQTLSVSQTIAMFKALQIIFGTLFLSWARWASAPATPLYPCLSMTSALNHDMQVCLLALQVFQGERGTLMRVAQASGCTTIMPQRGLHLTTSLVKTIQNASVLLHVLLPVSHPSWLGFGTCSAGLESSSVFISAICWRWWALGVESLQELNAWDDKLAWLQTAVLTACRLCDVEAK